MFAKIFVLNVTMMLCVGTLFAESEKTSFDAKKALSNKFIPRSEWSHDLDYKTLDVSYDGAKNLVSVHHTVTGSGFDKGQGIPAEKELEILKLIEHDHQVARKFADIAYHYVIGPSGNVYECRRLDIQGAHTLKLNPKNVGIAFLGCYDEKICQSEGFKVNTVTDAMVDSAARLAAYVSVVENFILSANNLVARSSYDREKLGVARFPGSPGNLVTDRMNEILSKALAYRMDFQALAASCKPKNEL